MENSKKLFILSLGCPKNLVDSEVMLGRLQVAGYSVCQTPEEADLLLVNTCGFIQSAVEEGIDEILSLVRIKEQYPPKLLVVTGCLVQRYGLKLQQELPEVDYFLGTEGFDEIVARIGDLKPGVRQSQIILPPSTFIMKDTTPRLISTPRHRAYLKITEGCANRCSFCMIPSIRGRLRSRTTGDLIKEAKRLDEAGVKELTLIGQDLTSYGLDLGPKEASLPGLLKKLVDETAVPWIRLLYLFPTRVDETLLDLIADQPRLVPYLDIPLQHVSPKILRAMNRPSDRILIDLLMKKIRDRLDPVAIRTTFMVGFPGETEEDVRQLEDFIRSHRLNHVGIFTYSNEEGCAAENMPDQINEDVKEERRSRLMELQAEVSLEQNLKQVGKKMRVLVEGESRETDLLLEGRTMFQAPEIDGCVYINDGVCNPGDFVDVQITEAHAYDLVGSIAETE
ncbi:MAG: 30S ribosomal protein S12 methylthiotransferase RimO [Proteobacteria bacterium]|nr:30S ribosomal protein S12 methylthiotransferase RimO [Pseudomonadota bacterium]MBU1708586.1 30S ribosomal protein S12 methylthiotransferase RimO [Pseudomonadota bacterium]